MIGECVGVCAQNGLLLVNCLVILVGLFVCSFLLHIEQIVLEYSIINNYKILSEHLRTLASIWKEISIDDRRSAGIG